MPRGGRKKRKMSTPQKVWSKVNSRSPRNDAEENADAEDLECYTELEVEEVGDEADRVVKEEDDDDEVHRIDASWIKQEPVDEEPVDEELYIHSQEEHNGDVHVMKRKRNEEGEDDPNAKYFKTEPGDEYVPVNLQELMRNIVKTEEEDDESDDYWEEDESDVVREEDRVHMRPPIPLQKCAKCAIMFTPGSSKLPSALQNLCKKCKPNVSMSCKICGKHFEHHKLYKRHMRDCGNNRYECSVCKNRFPTERKLNYHKCVEENFMRMLRYICPICSEGFEKAKYRNHHKSLHVTVKPIKCKSCKLQFTNLPAYQEHNDTHDVSRSFICSTCYVSFDTRAEFFADQRKHKATNGDKHEIERPPDFAYVCRKCKHWYSDLTSFRSHSCIHQKECFRGDFSQASVVPRLLDFSGEASEKMIHTGTRMDFRVLKEPPKPLHVLYPVKGPLLLPKPIPPVEVTVPPPADKEGQDVVLDSAYTCQLCQVSFKNSLALGFHSCLVQHNAFLDDDGEDEEEESDEPGDYGPFQGQSGDGAIRIKLTSGLKTLNFSDVMSQAEPNQATNQTNNIPTSSGTNGNQTNSNFKQSHRCLLCSTVVRHNFEPMLGKESARYLCPRCMKNAAKEKNCVFKCSKCGQTFPTWSRLHMHLPWHKEKTGEEGVFKEPHLACKYLPPRQEEASIPSSSKHSPSVSEVVSEPSSVRTEHTVAARRQPQESLPANVTNSDITLLSALLKEPVNPLRSQNKTTSNDTEAAHQEVKSRLRKKLADKSIHVRIAPKLPTANSLVGNQLVINAPLISPKNLGGGTVSNQDDSLFSQITRGMFPPVVDSTSKDLAKNEKEPSADPENSLNVQEYRHQGMRVKITKDGPRKTVQLLPDEPQVHVQPKTATGALLSPGQSAVSTSIPVGTIACVTAPLATGNTTVPLAFGGNSLKKTNLDGSSSSLTSLSTVYPKPPVISSVKQIEHSSLNLNIQNIQPAPSAPVLVSVPVDQSQPLNPLTPRGVFLCYSCNLIFMDIESLKTHGCRIKAFSCHLCSDTFQTPEQLYNHQCSTQTFTCHMCNKKCSSAKELNQHPCIDTNDIRIGKGSSNAGRDNPMNKGSVVEIETGGKGSITTGQGAGQGAGQREDGGEMDDGEMDKRFRALSWGELTKVKDYTCCDCSIKFNSQASLYIHKMKHNMRV